MHDDLMPDRSVDDLIAERDAAQEQVGHLRQLLEALVDDGPCEDFNHRGECETHLNTQHGQCMNAAALAYLAETKPVEAAATEPGLCSKCGGKLTACADCGHPALCGEAHCQAHVPDGGWDAHPLSETYPGSGIYE